jgi:putative redox protein
MTGTLITTVHVESGEPPHRQSIRIGHHTIVSDEPPTNGGGDAGPSPFGLLLGGLAACTSITLRMYADRKGWSLGTVTVDARMFRAADGTGFQIERLVRTSGPLSEEQKRRLAEIADKTPVTLALARGTPIATTFASGT